MSTSNNESLRHHPELSALFKAAESRHLTEAELEEYYRICPDQVACVSAAREIAAQEQSVVQKVVQEIFLTYPYAENHQMATQKCTRDITYVSAYATLAMLMNDPEWFDDKLLLWLKTILQSFEFPARAQQKRVLFGIGGLSDDKSASSLPAKRQSIFETYSKLRQRYQEQLSPSAFRVFLPYLQQAVDVLSAE